jgi:hypothetical protein
MGIGGIGIGYWEERERRFEIREQHPPKPPEVETSGNISSNISADISARGGAKAGDTCKISMCKRQERKGLEFLEKNWNEWRRV